MTILKCPEIRFKNEDGNNYPDWEEKKLDNVFKFYKGKGISKIELSEEGTPCIIYGELYTKYREVIGVVKSKTNIKKENKDKPIIEKLNNLYNIPYRKYFKNDAYKEGIKAESCYEDYLQKIIDIYNQQSSENKEISQRLLADEDRKYHKVFNLILKDMNTIHPWFRDEELVKNHQNLIYNA